MAVIAIVLLLFPISTSMAQNTNEQVWQHFLTWLAKARASDNPGNLLQSYRKSLIASGTAGSEADRELAAISSMMKTRQDGWRVIFNNVYSSEKAGFSTRPNATLEAAVSGRKPGRALDAGMGQGRNSVFLALKGWDVTGFDVSDAGLEIARKNAGKAGVRINAVQKSEKEFDYGELQWDLMVFTYVPFPISSPDYVQRLQRALRPGGLVVVESFATFEGSPVKRPVDIDAAALKTAFRDFRVRQFEDALGAPDWSPEKTRLVRMIAEKR